LEASLVWLLSGGFMMVLMSVSVVFISKASIRRILAEERRRMLAGLAHQKELLKSNIQTQEAERERISADLHDSLASKLNVARLMLVSADSENTLPVKKIIDEVIESSRKIAYELYPQALSDFGLVQVIKDLLRSVSESIGVRFVDLNQRNDSGLTLENEAHIFRIIQEIINNALKHSEASLITVLMRMSDRFLVLKIYDNGRGFDASAASRGHGRKNIESRVQIINGKFRIKSRTGSGTSFLIFININDQHRTD
jgi:two-component system NarL family sensor kinase